MSSKAAYFGEADVISAGSPSVSLVFFVDTLGVWGAGEVSKTDR